MRTGDIPALAQLNAAIFDSYVKAKSVLEKHDDAVVSVSGGADSDVMVDIIARLDLDHKARYIYFDTGLEYWATKDHLDYLEKEYEIKIERLKAKKPVPYCTKLYGQPFVSKFVSENCERMQRTGFKWEDKPYEVIRAEYDDMPIYTAKWWCNQFFMDRNAEASQSKFNIARNKWLKEYIIANPPTFKISSKCCTYAKKATAHEAQKDASLVIMGIRKAEGGVRSTAYKTCFDHKEGGQDTYRPIFWYTNADKDAYKSLFCIRNSDCYEIWGMKRTGCVGCPYNRQLFAKDGEIDLIKQYEPRLYKACTTVFKDSYEYTKRYRDFCAEMEAQGKVPNER